MLITYPHVAYRMFCDSISGDVIEAASFTLLEALADFFPSQQGALIRKLLELAKKQQEKAVQESEKLLDQMTSGLQSTPTPESQE